jgi:hypothetical protein
MYIYIYIYIYISPPPPASFARGGSVSACLPAPSLSPPLCPPVLASALPPLPLLRLSWARLGSNIGPRAPQLSRDGATSRSPGSIALRSVLACCCPCGGRGDDREVHGPGEPVAPPLRRWRAMLHRSTFRVRHGQRARPKSGRTTSSGAPSDWRSSRLRLGQETCPQGPRFRSGCGLRWQGRTPIHGWRAFDGQQRRRQPRAT